jgi:hypothetical protein
VKGAVDGNFGAMKGLKGATILEQSSREDPAGPGIKTYFSIWLIISNLHIGWSYFSIIVGD